MLRPAVTSPQLTFIQRFVIALTTFFRILANHQFARKVALLDGSVALPQPQISDGPKLDPKQRDLRPALQLLSALQREGRLIDFVQQDIVAYSDADVGAAARVVHEGCRRALGSVAKFVPVRDDAEGHSVTVPLGFDAASLVLTGNVKGAPPFRGTLKHRGWRAEGFSLPLIVGDAEGSVIAPAEVEL